MPRAGKWHDGREALQLPGHGLAHAACHAATAFNCQTAHVAVSPRAVSSVPSSSIGSAEQLQLPIPAKAACLLLLKAWQKPVWVLSAGVGGGCLKVMSGRDMLKRERGPAVACWLLAPF